MVLGYDGYTMKPENNAVTRYSDSLRERLRSYLSRNDIKQKELAMLLGVSPPTVSNNISRDRPMSESFIALLQERIPEEFNGALDTYLALKHPASSAHSASKSSVEQEERIAEIEEMMLALVRELAKRARDSIE